MGKIAQFDKENYFLSNFYPHQIVYDGIPFTSTEAAFQAAKTVDLNERRQFIGLDPSKAKRLGRRITLRPDWEEVKDGVMLDILRIKFSDKELAEKLIATGDSELIEGNYWHDNYWGDCTCERCISKPGKNTLGKILMQIRDEIK